MTGIVLFASFWGLAQPFQAGAGRIALVSGLGLVLGIRHSTDADHVVALSTIVSKQRSVGRAALIGSMWGLGHTITIFVVGSLIILFDVRIPVRLGLAMEFSVAVMLVALGLLNLTGVLQRVSSHFARTGELTSNGAATLHRHRTFDRFKHSLSGLGLFHSLRPLLIGLVHGLAGSAAVALLVLATIPNPVWATMYLLIFGLGTMFGMMLMTTLVSIPLVYGSKRFAKLNEQLALISGVISLCFGLLLMYQLGFVGGLFTRHPQWTPR